MRKTVIFSSTIIGLLFYIIHACTNSNNNGIERNERKKVIVDTISKKILMDSAFSSTIKIGNQEWMTNDLKVTEFLNGDPIKRSYSKKDWRSLNNQKKPCYRIINGNYFYNGYAIMDRRGLTPEAFKIPSSNDWDVLRNFLGGIIPMSKTITNYKWKQIYIDASTEHKGENTIGFNGKATGCILNTGVYNKGACSFWWTDPKYQSNIPKELKVFSIGFCSIEYQNEDLIDPEFGSCIRCIKK